MQKTSWRIQAPAACTTVFHRCVGSRIRSQASVYAPMCQLPGTNVGGVRTSSSGDFMAPEAIQYTGKRKASAKARTTPPKTVQ